MNNLIKNISVSFLLTASTLGVMASDDGSAAMDVVENNVSASGVSNKRLRDDEGLSFSLKKIKIEQGSSTDTASSQSSSASAATSTENSLSLETIKKAVTSNTFNLEGGAENCLECSLNFVSYILSGGTECRSAAAASLTESNFEIFNERYGEVIDVRARERFGEPVVFVHEDGPTVNDLTDRRFAGFTVIQLDSLHGMLFDKSKENDSDSVGILHLEYKGEFVKSPVNAHFMNYIILSGQLFYIDAQKGIMKKKLDTNSFKTACYRSFPLKKVQSIAGVSIKKEPVSYAVTTDVAVSSSSAISSLSNTSVLANNRLLAAVKILRDPALDQQHYDAAAETVMSLLYDTSVSANNRLTGANNILMDSTLTQHHDAAARVARSLLSNASVAADNRLVGAETILMNSTLTQHHAAAADAAEAVMSLLYDTSLSANNRLAGATRILMDSTLTQHHAAAADAVRSLLTYTSILAHTRLSVAKEILRNSTLTSLHAAAADAVRSLLTDTSILANNRLAGANEILKEPTFAQYHAAAAQVALSLLGNESLPSQLKEDAKLLLKRHIDSL